MKKKGTSMVAPLPTADNKLHPVEALAGQAGMPATMLAGLRRATGWVAGKQITEAQFNEAVKLFASRPMGSGRI